MTSVVSTFRTWADMVKLSHTIFALPFALTAAFLAGKHIEGRHWPHLGQLGLILVCMVSARSVAMTFNRIVDAAIDKRNPRTAQRPLPTGRLSVSASWIMLGLAGMTFGAGCVGFHLFYQNSWPILLSGPIMVYLCAYSYTKRFTKWSHYYLGSAIALSPAAAWLAIHPASFGTPALVMMATLTCWIGGFDIIYACQDIAVDRREGLYSLPSRLAPAKALLIARISHALVVVGLIVLGVVADLGLVYATGVVLVAGLLIIENSLVRAGDYKHVNHAFFTVNGLVSVVLAVSAIADSLL